MSIFAENRILDEKPSRSPEDRKDPPWWPRYRWLKVPQLIDPTEYNSAVYIHDKRLDERCGQCAALERKMTSRERAS